MESNKSNAIWVSNKIEQGVGETDWKQYAALMTTPQTTSNSSLLSATTSALTLSSTSLPVMLEESGGTKTLFGDSSKLTSTNNPDVTTGTVNTSHSFSNTYSYGFLVTPDGTQLGIWNYNSNQLQVYAMSTPYDLTTASNTNNISISDNGSLGDVRFNKDGTKVFATYGSSQSYYYSYPLSTAYDLSTLGSGSVTYTNSRNPDYAFAVSDTDTVYFSDWSYGAGLFEQGSTTMITLPDGTSSNIRSLYFEANGSVLYALRDNGILYQYSLSTPYDPSTASYNNLSLNIGGTISNPTSIQTAGGYLYIQKNPVSSTLYRISGDFSTSFEYDISSLSLSSAPTKAYQLPSCSVALGGNEIATNAYPRPYAAVSSSTTSVTMGYNTSTDPVISANDPIDVAFIKSAGLLSPGTKTTGSGNASNRYLRSISEDGLYAFFDNGSTLYRHPISTAFDLTTLATNNQNLYTNGYWKFLSYDGNHILYYQYGSRRYYVYSLSSAYDLNSTLTTVAANVDVSSQITSTSSSTVRQLFMSDDLRHIYIGEYTSSTNTQTIYHYEDNSFVDSLQISGGNNLFGLAISADGKTLYASGPSGSYLYEYSLGSPYYLSSATLTSSLSASGQGVGQWWGVALDPTTYTRLYFNFDNSGWGYGQYTSSGRFGGKAFSTTASSISLSGSNTVITFPQRTYAPDGLYMPDTSTAANFTGFTTSGSNWIIESDKVTLPGSDTGRYIQYKIEAPNSGMTTSNLQLNLWKLP